MNEHTKPIAGNCINLFIKDEDTYKTIAHSTVFSLKIDGDTSQVKSKDDSDNFEDVKVNNLTWEIEGESTVVKDDDTLFDLIISAKPITICYGLVDEGEQTPPSVGYIGKCLLTNLELVASTGDKPTYNYTLLGCSALVYGNIEDVTPDGVIEYSTKETPLLDFSYNESSSEVNEDNDYTIADLENPNDLPIKFKVTKIS